MAKPNRKQRAARKAIPPVAERVDGILDAQLPDFVRAELAGLDVQRLYADVFDYLRESAHARALYRELMRVEKQMTSRMSVDPDQAR